MFQYVKVYDDINIFLSSSPCVTEVTKKKRPDLHSFVNQGNSVQVSGIKVAWAHSEIQAYYLWSLTWI